MSKLNDFDDLVKVADFLVEDYDREGNYEAINDYAWEIYEVKGWCVSDFFNAYLTSRGVVDDDPYYGGEHDIEKQVIAACLNWLRDDVRDRLMRKYVASLAGREVSVTPVEELELSAKAIEFGAAREWRVTVECDDRSMTIPFYSGEWEVTAEDVLDTLARDLLSLVRDFEDWARDLEFDEDSQEAHSIWEAGRKQSEEFLKVLDIDPSDDLVYQILRGF